MSTVPSAVDRSHLKRYLLTVEYNGFRFRGFQRQTNPNSTSGDAPSKVIIQRGKKRKHDSNGKLILVTSTTIQEFIEDAILEYTKTSRAELDFKFAGRTDSGVHARGQLVAAYLPEEKDLFTIQKSINTRLPVDITISKVEPCESTTFDPRKDAKMKEYSYTIKYRRKVYDDQGELLPICKSGPHTVRSGLDSDMIWVSPWALDDSKMRQYCQQLSGCHDYSAFVHKTSRRHRDNHMTVEKFGYDILLQSNEDAPVLTVKFSIQAKGFGRAMVRNLVGFLVDLLRGSLTEDMFERIWDGTDEVASSINAAPACGLCLEKVDY